MTRHVLAMIAAFCFAGTIPEAKAGTCGIPHELFYFACQSDRCITEFSRAPGPTGPSGCSSYTEVGDVDPRLATLLDPLATQLRSDPVEGIYVLPFPRFLRVPRIADQLSRFGEEADEWRSLIEPVTTTRWMDLPESEQVNALLKIVKPASLRLESEDASESAVSLLRSEFEQQQKAAMLDYRLQWLLFWSVVAAAIMAMLQTARIFFHRLRTAGPLRLKVQGIGLALLCQFGLLVIGVTATDYSSSYVMLSLMVPVVVLIILIEALAVIARALRRRQQS